MIIKQLCLGSMDNFTYLIGDEATKTALVIDPAADVEPIIQEAQEAGLIIKTILNTHGHFDHTAGNAMLKYRTDAQIVLHKADAFLYGDADRLLDQETVFDSGELHFRVIHTPGHTPGGICLYAEDNLFTGDTLFVGDSGRTDLAGGDRNLLAKSLRSLMTLPEKTIVWPGHDYGPTPASTIGWEKRNNVNAAEYGF